MNGFEFRSIRRRLDLTEADFAKELGYTGKGKNRINLIRDFEGGSKQVPLYIARLAWLLGQIKDPTRDKRGDPTYRDFDGRINWPDWPGYTREELDDEVDGEKRTD